MVVATAVCPLQASQISGPAVRRPGASPLHVPRAVGAPGPPHPVCLRALPPAWLTEVLPTGPWPCPASQPSPLSLRWPRGGCSEGHLALQVAGPHRSPQGLAGGEPEPWSGRGEGQTGAPAASWPWRRLMAGPSVTSGLRGMEGEEPDSRVPPDMLVCPVAPRTAGHPGAICPKLTPFWRLFASLWVS